MKPFGIKPGIIFAERFGGFLKICLPVRHSLMCPRIYAYRQQISLHYEDTIEPIIGVYTHLYGKVTTGHVLDQSIIDINDMSKLKTKGSRVAARVNAEQGRLRAGLTEERVTQR
ncbi:hypothetical protein P3T76_016015 [Phytophthora citrophthora]|uniref:Uncharacterized protein n=1 Tax=Phytophthora citrophthora TaxID=4793 RepID=A0AAD9FYA2_9STRA|nr:hypothetical protein P3T76_016015 [Phytophthora citrophthora]